MPKPRCTRAMRNIGFDEKIWGELGELAHDRDVSVSHLVREFVKEGLERIRETEIKGAERSV